MALGGWFSSLSGSYHRASLCSTIMSALRGSGVLSSNLSKGGLYLDIALCGLCANIVFFAVKKTQGPTAIF